MQFRGVCKLPPFGGRRERSVGCDDCWFISTKEYALAVLQGEAPLVIY